MQMEIFNRKIHPLEQNLVLDIIMNDEIVNNCEHLWLFGSSVNGCSNKKHNLMTSDIDIMIDSVDKSNIDSDFNHNLQLELVKIFKKYGKKYDILWYKDDEMKLNPTFFDNVKKGVDLCELVKEC